MLKPFSSSTVCAVQVGQLVLNVTGPKPIAAQDWSSYVASIATLAPAWLANNDLVPVVLTYSPFEAPNAAQRAELAAKPHGPAMDLVKRVAFCTESTMVRGAMTAIGWLSRASTSVKPFRTVDKDKALDWLAEIAKFDRAQALAELQRMQLQLNGAASGSSAA